MTSKVDIGPKIRLAGALFALVVGVLAAASSPAAAFTTAGTSGSIGARTPDVPAYPNKCDSKNFYSGDFTTTQVWVSRTADPRYAGSTQYIGAWLTLKRYDSAQGAWLPVSIDGSTLTFLGWQATDPPTSSSVVTTLTTARFLPLTIHRLTPGWYTVEFQYHWWVEGAGYIGYARDVFNNDTYLRFMGVSFNSGPDAVATLGSCYVD